VVSISKRGERLIQNDESGGQRLLQKEVMQYLLNHPGAKDTVEGILHWWLPQTHPELRIQSISGALDVLVQKGWIRVSSYGETRVYGLQQTRREEILRWLES
jgi:hypothetical protein